MKNRWPSAVTSTVNTTISTTSSNWTATPQRKISISSTAILSIEGPFRFSACLLLLPGNVPILTFCISPGETTKPSKSTISTGSKVKLRPSIKIQEYIRPSPNCSAICLWATSSTKRLWSVMEVFPPSMASNFKTSEIPSDLPSHLRKDWCATSYGPTPHSFPVTPPAKEEPRCASDPMSRKGSWKRTISVQNVLSRSIDPLPWDETWRLLRNPRQTMRDYLQCTKLLRFFRQQRRLYQTERRHPRAQFHPIQCRAPSPSRPHGLRQQFQRNDLITMYQFMHKKYYQ